jgi:hypothetical protein
MARRIEDLEDEAVAAFARDLNRAMRALSREFLRPATIKKINGFAPDGFQTAFRAAMIESLGRDLIDRYSEIMSTTARDAFIRASRGVTDEIRSEARRLGLSPDLTRSSDAVVATLYGGLLDRLETVRAVGVDTMRSILSGWALGVERGVNPVREIAAQLDTSLARAITLVDTTIMGVDRAVLVQQADDAGVVWYAYDGPRDRITRPWCAPRVGYRFRISEIRQMMNDTGPNPPLIYGGGYNCRHRWIPLVDREAELEWPTR